MDGREDQIAANKIVGPGEYANGLPNFIFCGNFKEYGLEMVTFKINLCSVINLQILV